MANIFIRITVLLFINSYYVLDASVLSQLHKTNKEDALSVNEKQDALSVIEGDTKSKQGKRDTQRKKDIKRKQRERFVDLAKSEDINFNFYGYTTSSFIDSKRMINELCKRSTPEDHEFYIVDMGAGTGDLGKSILEYTNSDKFKKFKDDNLINHNVKFHIVSLVAEGRQSTIEIGDVGIHYYVTRFMLEDIDNAFRNLNHSAFKLINDPNESIFQTAELATLFMSDYFKYPPRESLLYLDKIRTQSDFLESILESPENLREEKKYVIENGIQREKTPYEIFITLNRTIKEFNNKITKYEELSEIREKEISKIFKPSNEEDMFRIIFEDEIDVELPEQDKIEAIRKKFNDLKIKLTDYTVEEKEYVEKTIKRTLVTNYSIVKLHELNYDMTLSKYKNKEEIISLIKSIISEIHRNQEGYRDGKYRILEGIFSKIKNFHDQNRKDAITNAKKLFDYDAIQDITSFLKENFDPGLINYFIDDIIDVLRKNKFTLQSERKRGVSSDDTFYIESTALHKVNEVIRNYVESQDVSNEAFEDMLGKIKTLIEDVYEDSKVERILRSIKSANFMKNQRQIIPYINKLKNIHNKIDWAVSSWCFMHLVDPVGTYKKVFDMLRPKYGIMDIDGFPFPSKLKDEEEPEHICNPSHLINALHRSAQPFIVRYDSDKRMLNILIKRENDKKLELPLEYGDEVYLRYAHTSHKYFRSYILKINPIATVGIRGGINYTNDLTVIPDFLSFFGDSSFVCQEVFEGKNNSKKPITFIRHPYVASAEERSPDFQERHRAALNKVFNNGQNLITEEMYQKRYGPNATLDRNEYLAIDTDVLNESVARNKRKFEDDFSKFSYPIQDIYRGIFSLALDADDKTRQGGILQDVRRRSGH